MYTLILDNFQDEDQYITIEEDDKSLGSLYFTKDVGVHLLVESNIFESPRHTHILHLACLLIQQRFPFTNCQTVLSIHAYQTSLTMVINSNCSIQKGTWRYDEETFRTSIDEWHPICDIINNWLKG